LSVETLKQEATSDGKIALTVQQNITKEEEKELVPVPPHVQLLLDMFVTHADRPVYAFKHLPPDFIAGLFSRYSRSGKPLVEVFIELCEEMGEEFTDEVSLVSLKSNLEMLDKFANHPTITKMHDNYTKKGHESVKKLADGISVAIDSCSMLAASQIFNGRTGFQGMERSSRYQTDFFAPNYVRNLFKDDQNINMRFDLLMNTAFKTAKMVYDDVYAALLTLYPYDINNPYNASEKQWAGWIKTRALDNARYALPVATVTGLGLVGNSMAFERMCEKLVSTDSEEMQALGGLIGEAVQAVCPTVFTMPTPSHYESRYSNFADPDIAGFREPIMNSVANESKVLLGPPTSDVDICRLALDRAHMNSEDVMLYYAAVAVGRQLGLPPDVVYHWMCSPWFKKLASLEHPMPGFSDSKKIGIISHVDFALRVIGKYSAAYDKDGQITNLRTPILKPIPGSPDEAEIVGFKRLPRFFELVNLTFDMVVDFGAWRDLNRHNIMSNIQWPLIPNLGFAVPDDYDLCTDTTKDVYQSLFAMSVDMWESLTKKYGVFKAQYAGLMMWNQRRWLSMNVREADYIISLRSRWPGHHSYRRIAQLMHKRIISLWPTMRQLLVCDSSDYVFGPKVRTKDDKKNSNAGIPISKQYIPMSQRVEPGDN